MELKRDHLGFVRANSDGRIHRHAPAGKTKAAIDRAGLHPDLRRGQRAQRYPSPRRGFSQRPTHPPPPRPAAEPKAPRVSAKRLTLGALAGLVLGTGLAGLNPWTLGLCAALGTYVAYRLQTPVA